MSKKQITWHTFSKYCGKWRYVIPKCRVFVDNGFHCRESNCPVWKRLKDVPTDYPRLIGREERWDADQQKWVEYTS